MDTKIVYGEELTQSQLYEKFLAYHKLDNGIKAALNNLKQYEDNVNESFNVCSSDGTLSGCQNGFDGCVGPFLEEYNFAVLTEYSKIQKEVDRFNYIMNLLRSKSEKAFEISEKYRQAYFNLVYGR